MLLKLDIIKRMVSSKARKVNKMWDGLLNDLIDDHASRPASEHGGEDSDFTDVLLSVQQEYNLTRDHIKAQLEVCITSQTAPTYYLRIYIMVLIIIYMYLYLCM